MDISWMQNCTIGFPETIFSESYFHYINQIVSLKNPHHIIQYNHEVIKKQPRRLTEERRTALYNGISSNK